MNRRTKRALLLINPQARRGGETLDENVARLNKGGLDIAIEQFSALPEMARDIDQQPGGVAARAGAEPAVCPLTDHGLQP